MFLLVLLFPLLAAAQKVDLPQPYRSLIKGITPEGVKVKVNTFGETFHATLSYTEKNGLLMVDISDDDFLSFYSSLFEELTKSKPQEVSITVYLNGQPLPYNPFFQLWDREFRLRLLKFSRLKPGCKPPVVRINASGMSGIKVWVSYEEVEKKLFQNGFKMPSYYCF